MARQLIKEPKMNHRMYGFVIFSRLWQIYPYMQNRGRWRVDRLRKASFKKTKNELHIDYTRPALRQALLQIDIGDRSSGELHRKNLEHIWIMHTVTLTLPIVSPSRLFLSYSAWFVNFHFSTVCCFLTTLECTFFFAKLWIIKVNTSNSFPQWNVEACFAISVRFRGGGGGEGREGLRMKLKLFVSQACANFCDGPLR